MSDIDARMAEIKAWLGRDQEMTLEQCMLLLRSHGPWMLRIAEASLSLAAIITEGWPNDPRSYDLLKELKDALDAE